MGVKRDAVVAGSWGFVEATAFFIVPDVWLTWLAFSNGRRRALIGALAALAGAVPGGLLVYWLATLEPAQVTGFIQALPGISTALIDRVGADLTEHGAVAIVAGAFQGVPYKIYAVQAPAAGIGPIAFALISIPARGLRFALVAAIAAAIAGWMRCWPARIRLGLLAAFWIVFYAGYFWLMS